MTVERICGARTLPLHDYDFGQSLQAAQQAQQEREMRAHAERHGVAVGQYRCDICGKAFPWAEQCDCKEAAFRRQCRESQLADLRASIPAGWRWASLDNPEWSKIRKSFPRGDKVARIWTQKTGSVLLAGPTGIGKTAVARALVRRLGKEAVEQDNPPVPLGFVERIEFMSMHDIACARRNSPLGAEAPMIVDAFRASLLVVDEVGFEQAQPGLFFEILNKRYDAGAPTIVTTGLTIDDFRKRYGAAALRRITDRGIMIDAHPAGEVAKP